MHHDLSIFRIPKAHSHTTCPYNLICITADDGLSHPTLVSSIRAVTIAGTVKSTVSTASIETSQMRQSSGDIVAAGGCRSSVETDTHQPLACRLPLLS